MEIADKPPGFGSGLELIFRFNLESLRPTRLEERAPGKGIYPAIPQNPAGRGSVVGMRPQAKWGFKGQPQPGWGSENPRMI